MYEIIYARRNREWNKFSTFFYQYLLKYEIKVSTITIIENSDLENELIFRIISPEQNNEFMAEYVLKNFFRNV